MRRILCDVVRSPHQDSRIFQKCQTGPRSSCEQDKMARKGRWELFASSTGSKQSNLYRMSSIESSLTLYSVDTKSLHRIGWTSAPMSFISSLKAIQNGLPNRVLPITRSF